MIKNVFKFGLAVAACCVLVSPKNAAATESGFQNWQECDDYMYNAYKECHGFTQVPHPAVTEAQCQASWEVTCEYCDTHYQAYPTP